MGLFRLGGNGLGTMVFTQCLSLGTGFLACSKVRGPDSLLLLQTAGVIHSTHISYLEIYNESGYDLLDPKHEGAKLEDLA